MKIETHLLNELHAFRYTGDDPRYALVISHGLGGHGGIYDRFCEHHAPKSVDIWSYDAPGHGRSTTNRPKGQWQMSEWAQASRDFAQHVNELTGLPVFTLGSSLGVGAAIAAIDSDHVTGAILMGSGVVPGSAAFEMAAGPWRSEEFKQIIAMLGRGAQLHIPTFFNFDEDYGYRGAQKQKELDPYNTWNYDLASMASIFQYTPPVLPADNTKPVLYTSGERDPNFAPEMLDAMASNIGGPVKKLLFKDAHHQLMLFETERFSEAVHEFCLDNIEDQGVMQGATNND